MIDSGKLGFIITLIALLVVCATFASIAWMGGSDQKLQVLAVSVLSALVGHFFLGGAEYRRQMIAARKSKD